MVDGEWNYVNNPTYQKNTMWKSHNSLVSYFGRFNYNLLDRYLLTATFRADGSSRFQRWQEVGLLPSSSFCMEDQQRAFPEECKMD